MRVWVSFIISLVSLNVSSQKALNVDVGKIKEYTSSISSPNYYPTLLNRFIAFDTTLTSKQLHFLYYGKFFQSFYHPTNEIAGREEMYEHIKEEDFEAALVFGKQAFEQDPLDLKTLFGIALCYNYMGNEKDMDQYLFLYYALTSVIVESGSGKSAEDAMVVMSISDEYEIVSNLGKEVKKQKLIENRTNVLYLKKSKDPELNKIKKLYFNVELPMLKVVNE